MRKRLLVWGLIASCIQAGTAYGVEATGVRSVDRVIVDPSYYYVAATPSGWGATSCPNAIYIYISRTASNARDILAAFLTAKAAGRQIQALGDCTDASYFIMNYVIVY